MVAGSCECGNKPSGSIKCGELLVVEEELIVVVVMMMMMIMIVIYC
jgi:hypothetical protein